MPYGPPLYGIFWGHIFCEYGGGGGQNYFQIETSTYNEKVWAAWLALAQSSCVAMKLLFPLTSLTRSALWAWGPKVPQGMPRIGCTPKPSRLPWKALRRASYRLENKNGQACSKSLWRKNGRLKLFIGDASKWVLSLSLSLSLFLEFF